MEYDIYSHSNNIDCFRMRAKEVIKLVANSVLNEICLYLIMEESTILIENIVEQLSDEDLEHFIYPNNWAYDLFDDIDVYTLLYSWFYLNTDNTYHFSHWLGNKFYA